MDQNTSAPGKGLLHSLTVLATTLVAVVYTRLDLLSTDLEEDREHLLSLLKLSLTALFCFGVGVLLTTILLVALFWDTQRILVLSLLSVFFLLCGFATLFYTMRKARNKPRLFSSSMLELLKDRQKLDSHF